VHELGGSSQAAAAAAQTPMVFGTRSSITADFEAKAVQRKQPAQRVPNAHHLTTPILQITPRNREEGNFLLARW
jgi:hypothetical protein